MALTDVGDTWTPGRRRGVSALFAGLIFVNATLLFSVQPMFTKMVLPLLGGTPAVWNTCLLFFQGALLLGYLYAHVTSQRLSPRTQGMVHLGLMVVALAFLPISVSRLIEPPVGSTLPVLWLLAVLCFSIGVPFTLIAAGAPMFQRWFSSTTHPGAGNPYVLYVASNLGSFVALLAYPFLIEPRLRLGEQGALWRFGYLVLMFLVATAWWVMRGALRENDPGGDEAVVGNSGGGVTLPNGGGPQAPSDDQVGVAPHDASINGLAETAVMPGDIPSPTVVVEPPPSSGQRLRWLLLSLAPSSLLIGVTTFISTDVAAVPLLWVVPLALYLLTFVIVFAERPVLHRGFMLVFQLLVGLALLIVIGMTPTKLKAAHLALHLLGFFGATMVCHRALADSRPAPRYLTEFYLWMSVGGMLGGVFNVVLAPLMYDRVLEYPMALIMVFGLRPVARRQSTSALSMGLDLALPVAVFGALVLLYRIDIPPGTKGLVILWTILGTFGLIIASFHRRPLRLALGAAALYLAVDRRNTGDDVLYQTRSFFGVYKVLRWGEHVILQSGTTTHGAQSLVRSKRGEPLTYYNRGGPLADAFAILSDTTRAREVAIVGLGAGTTACYSKGAERWTYYEIDPAVVRIARDGRWFTYLGSCDPQAKIELGDARLSIVRAKPGSYDLMIFDAFSSDAIPVHLMTREAIQLYLSKLKPGGSLLFHISNRYLDLEPVLAELARDAQLASAARDHQPSTEEGQDLWYSSRWVAITRDADTLVPLRDQRGWRDVAVLKGSRVWTDDYSDVLSVLGR